jgi:hypothetical protein
MLTLAILFTTLLTACLAQWDALSGVGWLNSRAQGYETVWPQQWSFFTGLDKNQLVDAYDITPDGTLGTSQNQRTGWSDYAWGLNRAGGTELLWVAQLAQSIPQEYWQQCGNVVPSACRVERGPRYVFMSSDQPPVPGLCGLTAVAVELPGASAVGQLPRNPRTVFRVAVVNLPCPRR